MKTHKLFRNGRSQGVQLTRKLRVGDGVLILPAKRFVEDPARPRPRAEGAKRCGFPCLQLGVDRRHPSHRLTRGQIGTVVEHLERHGEPALRAEFSDARGQTYAMAPVRPERLLVLAGNTD